MSLHAELESLLRDLPPVSLAMLNQARAKAIAQITTSNPRPALVATVGAAAIADPRLGPVNNVLKVQASSATTADRAFLDNIRCLKESVASELPPRLVCDSEWRAKVGADEGQISTFVTAYDKWESLLEAVVHNHMKKQDEIRTKRNVAIPLSFRLEAKDGSFVEQVFVKEDDWNSVFGKLMPTTKISKITLWAILWLLEDARPSGIPADDAGIFEIRQLVGRSIEVRTDPALSALKVVYNPKFQTLTKTDFSVEQTVTPGGEVVLSTAFEFGNPLYIAELVHKKVKLAAVTLGLLTNGYFLAMHDENHEFFDYLMTQDNSLLIADSDQFNFLFQVALNCMRSRNNDTFIFKLVFVTERKWVDVGAAQTTVLENNFKDHLAMLVGVDQRTVLRNVLLDKLSAGKKPESVAFLKRVGRTGSKSEV